MIIRIIVKDAKSNNSILQTFFNTDIHDISIINTDECILKIMKEIKIEKQA